MSIIVDDKASVFSPSHVSDMNSAGSRFPFEYHVVTGKYANTKEVDDAAHACVSAPNMVCTVIDPVLHRTSAHFGTATGVKGSDFNIIAAAGNTNFKAGDWGKGVLAIGDRALESATSAKGTTVVVQPAKGAEVDNTGMYVTGGLFIALCAGIGYWFYRQNKKDTESFKTRIDNDMTTFREEASTYRARNIEEEDFHKKLMATAPKVELRYNPMEIDPGGYPVVKPRAGDFSPPVHEQVALPRREEVIAAKKASVNLADIGAPVMNNRAAYFDKGTYKVPATSPRAAAKPATRSSSYESSYQRDPNPIVPIVVVDNSRTDYYSTPTRRSNPPPPPPSERKPAYSSYSSSSDDSSSSSSSSSSWSSSSSSDSGGSSSSYDSGSSSSYDSGSSSGGGGSDW